MLNQEQAKQLTAHLRNEAVRYIDQEGFDLPAILLAVNFVQEEGDIPGVALEFNCSEEQVVRTALFILDTICRSGIDVESTVTNDDILERNRGVN